MATVANSYEEARKKRLQENLKKIEGLGITAIKESLSELAKCKAKKCSNNPISKKGFGFIEVRRSSRARNLVSSYREDESDDVKRRYMRSYNRRGCGKRTYNGAFASYEERVQAMKRAEKIKNRLDSVHPSFVKPMVRSHVSSCFWLGLPSWFCKNHLSSEEVNMILENENGDEYGVVYIGSRSGLSGGWKGFALDHQLEDGDVLLFELVQSDRFKVYIFKAAGHADQDNDGSDDDNDGSGFEESNGKPDKEVDCRQTTEQKELPSPIRSSKECGRPVKGGKDKKSSDRLVPAKSALKAGDEDAPNIQEWQKKNMSSKNRAKTKSKQENDNNCDNKIIGPEDESKSAQEIKAEDATEIQDLQVKIVKSKGRVKRPPRCSRI